MAAHISQRSRFAEVFLDYYPVAYSAVYSKIGNAHDAEDICQELFLRLYTRLDGVDNVRKWIFIALNLIIKEYYRKNRRDVADIDDIFDDAALSFVNGFRDTRIIIKEVLEEEGTYADDLDRVVFELVAMSGYSYAEAAGQLGLTRRQVEYRYTQIGVRVKERLRQRGVKHLEDLL
ncbi:MAG: RNA polymerase sigma factor [Spirochaetes bacterium]|nr:MAG: RNA polymerase sigma factor [Spirochaetota bacterium]